MLESLGSSEPIVARHSPEPKSAATQSAPSTDAGPPPTRRSIIRGVRDGRDESWKTFFEIYGPIVYRYARHARLSRADADDVVARVMRSFLRVFRNGFEYEPEVGRFRDYLRTVANNEIRFAWRLQARRVDGELPREDVLVDSGRDPVEHWSGIEREERFQICLNALRQSAALSKRDLDVFDWYVLRGMPAERVAAHFRISKARVFSIKHEITQRLKALATRLNTVLGEV